MEVMRKACAAAKGKKRRSLNQIVDDELDRKEKKRELGESDTYSDDGNASD